MSLSCGLKRHRAEGHLKTPSVSMLQTCPSSPVHATPSTLVAEPSSSLYSVFNSPHTHHVRFYFKREALSLLFMEKQNHMLHIGLWKRNPVTVQALD